MKRIAILGSTGSIGRNTLAVIKRFPKEFSLAALTARTDIATLKRQAAAFHPDIVGIADITKAGELSGALGRATRLYVGQEGVAAIASLKDIDVVVVAISGSAALFPLLAAIKSGKTILLANKEALVMAGALVTAEAKRFGATLIPVDSEASAIWQCLRGEEKSRIKKIYLTASGGPLYDVARADFSRVSLARVLNHPRWRMGKKISVDSATLMNKGLEVIEAHWLFGVEVSQIEVVVHRQAVIHSMVEFIDGVVMAQLSVPDMRIPIQHALTFPKRREAAASSVDFFALGSCTFEKPAYAKFPCLKIAYAAARAGGTLPAVLNAANEEAVGAFLKNRIRFVQIAHIVERVVFQHRNQKNPRLREILAADNWARASAAGFIRKG